MPESDNICVDCGLCCDGTLFTDVDLEGTHEHPAVVVRTAQPI